MVEWFLFHVQGFFLVKECNNIQQNRVGHIYRLEGWDGNPPPAYVPQNPSMRNYRRVIETWWDEYKEYFYVSRPESKTLDYGDTSVQQKFRKGSFDLHCQFQTYFKITVHILLNGSWIILHTELLKNVHYHP